MAANKVVFGNKVLIDLTGDTVTEEALLKGYTAHKADGTIITGTAFAGYPNEFVFLDNIEDSSGNPIKDSSGKNNSGTNHLSQSPQLGSFGFYGRCD